MKKKLLVVSLCAIIAIMAIAGSSLAWLQDSTDTVVNTFTEGKVDITLTETTGSEYKMVPSKEISKDPIVSVSANSEACWLFVKVTEINNVDTFLTYDFADGWEILEGTFDHDPTNGNETVIVYRAITAESAKTGVSYPVLKNNQVVVKNTVEMSHMDSIATNKPQLTFTAYAIQQLGTGTAAQAWATANFN